MPEIVSLLSSLRQCLDRKTWRQLTVISQATLTMTGRVTMLGISRWAGKGGSYRTVQRFFGLLEMPWLMMNWLLAKASLSDANDVILLAADEVVASKSGKQTFGLNIFFSSLQQRMLPGVGFLGISLISVTQRRSFPMAIVQIMKDSLQGCSKYKGQRVEPDQRTVDNSKRKPGRPKGSKNKNRRDVELSPYLQFVKKEIGKVLALVRPLCQPHYLVFDGELGNNFGVQMASRLQLHLISKLRRNAELYLPWEGEYSGRGHPRIYGDRLQVDHIPERYRVATDEENGVRTEVFQIQQARHKKFADALNVVIIRKTVLDGQRVGYVILFSSDHELEWAKLVDYYSLRFQIEFDFRDAKQYWGLEDFMVTREQRVRNSASFSFFMINLSRSLIAEHDGRMGKSVHDLKIWFLARKQVLDVLKLCGQNPEEVFIQELIHKISTELSVNTV